MPSRRTLGKGGKDGPDSGRGAGAAQAGGVAGRLAEARGIALEPVGKDLRGRCPFHERDDEPSLFIDPVRNVFHCFGCGAKGSVVDFVMKAEGVSFRHAVEILRPEHRAAAGSGDGRSRSAPLGSTVRRLPAPVSLDADDHELLDQVVGYYHETLRSRAAALEYLASRGLDHPDFAEPFRLGFANRTLGYRLPNKNRVAGAEIRGRLQELGIFRESGPRALQRLRGLPDPRRGGPGSRALRPQDRPGLKPRVARHLYLPGPRRGIFNLARPRGRRGGDPLREPPRRR